MAESLGRLDEGEVEWREEWLKKTEELLGLFNGKEFSSSGSPSVLDLGKFIDNDKDIQNILK